MTKAQKRAYNRTWMRRKRANLDTRLDKGTCWRKVVRMYLPLLRRSA